MGGERNGVSHEKNPPCIQLRAKLNCPYIVLIPFYIRIKPPPPSKTEEGGGGVASKIEDRKMLCRREESEEDCRGVVRSVCPRYKEEAGCRGGGRGRGGSCRFVFRKEEGEGRDNCCFMVTCEEKGTISGENER